MRPGIALITVACLSLFEALCFGTACPGNVVPLIEQSARQGFGITQQETEVAEYVRSLGPDVIPHLLPLLKHEDRNVRELACHTLKGMSGLRESDLDALMDAVMELALPGDHSHLYAIAQIGTPKAIAFLAGELRKARQKRGQITHAFERLGEKGVPCLVDLIKSDSSNEQLLIRVVFILGRLGDKAESAVVPLTNFTSKGQGNYRSLEYAVVALGRLGSAARGSVPVLVRQARDNPALEDTVNQALVNLGVSEAVPGLLRRLKETPDRGVFWDIARLRENGRAAGPVLIGFLKHKNWVLRVHAARVVGFIGYAEASPHLIELLCEGDDWRLVYAAIRSLSLLRSEKAIPALAEVSENHWYPSVRKAAKTAILVIKGELAHEPEKTIHPSITYFNYMSAGITREFPFSKGDRAYVDREDLLDKELLSKLAYSVDKGSRKRIPDVGIRLEGGYLVGSDGGEFGGELVIIDAAGKQTMLLGKNVLGIHRMTSGVVVIAGYAHMWTDEGILYRVSRDNNGAWYASRWKALPGFASDSGLLASGNLFVECSGGDIEISPSGDIKMAERSTDSNAMERVPKPVTF